MRKEWEELNGREWPIGCVVHHICPLADGGSDTGDNVEPKDPKKHIQDHKDNGDFSRWGKRGSPKKAEPEKPPTETKKPQSP